MYLLFGYGKSNQSIEKYFVKNDVKYTIYDDKFTNINEFIKNNYLSKIDIIIKSNGINNNHPLLNLAREKHIMIISDLQLFYNFTRQSNYCLVTGSNGKTTIVSLLERCLNNAVSIGNNGLAFFDQINNNKYKVLEVSSFMLENIKSIKYKYNIISNIYPTHLEHHSNYVNYVKSKIAFLKNLTKNDYVIYDKDSVIVDRIISCYEVNKITVSLIDQSATLFLNNNYIYYKNINILDVRKLKIMGNHNITNIMLVLGVILNHELLNKEYLEKIYNYSGEQFRMEKIYDSKFKIINDSKSTNFKALCVALNCFEKNIVLIVGGKTRKDNYKIIDKHLKKLIKVYCYGENKEEFYNYFKNNNIETYKFANLKQLVANLQLDENNILLFSPGSISYDQFKDFEERGKYFNELIKDYLSLKH